MERYSDTVLKVAGTTLIPAIGASVTVYDNGTANLSTIYSDNGITPTANPLTTNGEGRFYFYASDGSYDLYITGTGITSYTLPDVTLDEEETTSPFMATVLDDADASTARNTLGSVGSAELISSGGSALIGFLQSGTGATTRTVQAKLRDNINVKDFGAIGDGVTDDTSAIQSAIDAGWSIDFPDGDYLVTSLSISQQRSLFGRGRMSRILAADNSSTVIDISSGAINTRIVDLSFDTADSTQRSGGIYISTAAYETYIGRCKFVNGYSGIDIGTANSIVDISQCVFDAFNTSGASDVIAVNTTGADIAILECVFNNTVSTMPRSGIRVRNVQDISISGCNIIHCGIDFLIDPPNGSTVASIYAVNTFFDTADIGIQINPDAGGTVVRSHFVNCWTSSHTSQGVDIYGVNGTISGVTFINHQSNLNGADGIRVEGPNTNDVFFLGGECAQNVGSGIALGTSSTKTHIRNMILGATHGLTGNAFGAYVNAGASNYSVIGCISESNTSGQIIDVAQTGNVFNNIGGPVTKNTGTGSIDVGTSSVVITHGLNATPSAENILLIPTTAQSGNSLYLDSTSITSTQFTARLLINAAGSAFTFTWNATVQGA